METVQSKRTKRSEMKQRIVILGLVLAVFAAGCSSVSQRRAMVDGRVISNPSLGFFGFSFEMPEGFDLYNPAVGTPEQYGEIQQLAIRIYNLNRAYHPRGNETFYDSFLMLSENTAVLLMTLKYDYMSSLETDFEVEEVTPQADTIPLYNVSAEEVLSLGDTKAAAVYTRGYAYEHKGWYYAGNGRRRKLFHYEACKALGNNRDGYVLMGFCLPEHTSELSLQMQEMMPALRF